MLHCRNFKSDDIWFLNNTKEYVERRLYLGFCPECSKEVGELCEIRISDNQALLKRFTGKKLEKLKEVEKCNVLYTSQQINKNRFKKPFGWIYGVNKESKSKNKTVIKQYRKDFTGTKELVKTINIT